MAANYAWKLTYCRDEDEQRLVGLVGPRKPDVTLIDDQVSPQRFRMYTDDWSTDLECGEATMHVYEGVLYGDPDVIDGFEPLDDFGTPNYGCAIIAIWQAQPPQFLDSIMEESDGGYWVML
jgi:hypothetical protein